MMSFALKAAPQLLPKDVKADPSFLTRDVEPQMIHTSLYYQVEVFPSLTVLDHV